MIYLFVFQAEQTKKEAVSPTSGCSTVSSTELSKKTVAVARDGWLLEKAA